LGTIAIDRIVEIALQARHARRAVHVEEDDRLEDDEGGIRAILTM
jgi:hypothetical protein